MSQPAILYPAFLMFCLTLGFVCKLGMTRLTAIKMGKVKASFYKTYDHGREPEQLRVLTRHVQNHFEIPPLFYMAVLLSFITHNDSLLSLISAWGFVMARGIHSYVHMGSNQLMLRFKAYGLSLLFLSVLWVSTFIHILSEFRH